MTNICALKSLNQPTHTWDTLIIHIVKIKLDAVTVREWEEYKVNNEIPNLKQFLKGRADLLESVEANKSPSGNHKDNSKSKTRSSNPRSLLSVERHDSTYTVCKNNHQVYNCEVFLGLSAPQRVEKIRSLKACLNCLKSGHTAPNCKSGSCRKCGKKHNTLLHLQSNSNSQTQQATNVQDTSVPGGSTTALSSPTISNTLCFKKFLVK